jgi:PTS system N-acetylglucosamine-specific IIC component
MHNAMAQLVNLGKALMLPIAVLPIAAILLRIGQPDLMNIPFVAEAGSAIFSNLPAIFSIGVAIGFAKDGHGSAALAGYIGFLVLTGGLKVIDPKIDMGVFSGIIMGITAGVFYNKYKDVNIPNYLAFFGGRRLIPIITGVTAVIFAFIFSFIWPPIQNVITGFGDWIIASGNIGLFSFGAGNRLLLPFGLHHILNNFVWYSFGEYFDAAKQIVVHGDLLRFFAKDPASGTFMAGFFPVMMFGLPGACLAMVHNAKKGKKKLVFGLVASMALTSFLTGITEPIEFTFMFLAFPLYIIHSLLTGLSLVIMNLLHVRLGFGFSAGLFDYLLNYGISTKPLLLIPVGLAYFALYFVLFDFFIKKWDLKTPGREDDSAAPAEVCFPVTPGADGGTPANADSPAAKYLAALGGKENIVHLSNCATRIRMEVKDASKVNDAILKNLGAKGVMKSGKSVQVIIGPEVERIADGIKAQM